MYILIVYINIYSEKLPNMYHQVQGLENRDMITLGKLKENKRKNNIFHIY